MRDYLPSKQFTARVIVLAIIVLLVFGIYSIVKFFKNRSADKNATALIIKPDVIQKDSNDNGIPDWEESLWGLDPFKNGESNKEFILAKREALAKENNIDPNSGEPLSENDTLSREFFAIIMSLQQSGNLDEASMEAVGNTIGEKITATPIPDIYTKEMILTIKTNPANTNAYYEKLGNLINKYDQQDVGRELTFISVGLSTEDPQAFVEAEAVASAYRAFAKELIKIQVPTPLSATHLSLANNYEKVAQSIEGMAQMLTDPIIGMRAVINYKKYTDALVSDIDKLSNDL